MSDNLSSIMESIKTWHRQQHGKDIKAAFQLGDMIINAVINSGLTEYQVIKRIRDYLGKDLAYGTTTYNRSARLVRVFTRTQRETLVTHGVPVDRCEVLAGKEFDGRKRIKFINDIKTGKIKTYSLIQSTKERQHYEDTETLRHGLTHTNDVIGIQIRNHGEFQRDLMFDGLRSLVSQVPQVALIDEMNKAIADCVRRGAVLKPLTIKRK